MRCALSTLSGVIGIHLSPTPWRGRVNYYANKIFIFSFSLTYPTNALRSQVVSCLNASSVPKLLELVRLRLFVHLTRSISLPGATNHLKSNRNIYLGIWPLWF